MSCACVTDQLQLMNEPQQTTNTHDMNKHWTQAEQLADEHYAACWMTTQERDKHEQLLTSVRTSGFRDMQDYEWWWSCCVNQVACVRQMSYN